MSWIDPGGGAVPPRRAIGRGAAARSAEVEAGVEEACEPLPRRRGVLRLLADALEVERPAEVEVPEREADVPDSHPGPRQPGRGDEQQRVDHPQTEQRGPGDARGEAGGAEARVLPEEAPLAGQEPDPAEPEGWQGQDHREQERTEELPATALEIEALAAEVRVRD